MISTEVQTIINRPIAEVYSFLTDVEKLPEYATGVTQATWLAPGWVGIGSKFRVTRLLMTAKNEMNFEVSDVRPNKLFSFHTVGGNIPIQSSLSFESVPKGTRVVMKAEAQEPKGILKLAIPMFVRKVTDQLEVELDNAKRLLEGKTKAR